MLSDTILHKYMRHLRQMNGGGYTSMDAVELALRLALEELAESIPSTPSTSSTSSTELAALQADLERLQTAADTEVVELRSQLAQLDADNAAMIRRNKEMADELRRCQERADHLSDLAAVMSDPRFTDEPGHTNGAAANQQYVPADIPFCQQPQFLDLLDDEAKDWWIGVAAGRHAWRTVPKSVQLRMIRHILSFGPENGSMKMTEFDAIKPDWMPSANSHTKTLGLSWQQMNDWAVEL